MIARTHHLQEVARRLSLFPVVAIIGARQVGKTTLAKQVAAATSESVTYFDLEKPSDLARLAEPQLALEPLRGLVVLDEIQRLPEVFPLLRVLVDRPDLPARFLVLGSASPILLRQSSESLAGRITYLELPGISLREVSMTQSELLWVRGGFPRALLAPDDAASDLWRQEFIRTYLERDLPALGYGLAPTILRRFWTMLAHNHGQLWNGSRLASSLGIAHTTARSYLDVLCDTFMARQLTPYLANTGKRQVKSPKVYLVDTGILHALLGILDRDALAGHPIVGASWGGFAMDQVIRSHGAEPRHCFFWAVHTGGELDLLIERGTERLGFEFKRSLTPTVSRSMRSALETLDLASLTIVYPGADEYRLAGGVVVRPLSAFAG